MFCVLEKDEKTYNYLKNFIIHMHENREDPLVQLDNLIQKGEIQRHLVINGYAENDKLESLNWVKSYACDFRSYLNTMKIAALYWSLSHRNEELTWEAFCELADRINDKKPYLDAIHT